MQAALDAEVARMAALEDPTSQVRAVGDFFAALDQEFEKVAEVRLAAVVACAARASATTGLPMPPG